MNTSQFMDKQIMDLSNSQTNNNTDFLDLINPAGGDSDKKEEILPNYDFQPIRPAGSSPSTLDSAAATATGAPRAWNSAENNNAAASGTRNYTSMESYEPARYVLDNDQTAIDANLVSEIDRTMKKYADNLMHGLDGISARVSQLESRTRHLESSLDELKVSVGTNYGSSDGRMRQLENILREVHNGVQTIRDKHEIMDARLELAKLQLPKAEQHADVQSTEHADSSSQAAISVNQQPHQQFPPAPLTHPSSAPPPNAPQQITPPQFQVPGHFPSGQIPSGPPPPVSGYFAPPPPPPGQALENQSQQYQLQAPSQPPPQHQYQQPPQLPYSQPPAPSQPHNPLPSVTPSQQQPQPHLPLTHHHPEESPYGQPQSYPPAGRQNPPPHTPSAAPPQQQYYGAPANMYEPPPNRPGPGFSGSFGPSAGSGEQFPYGSPSSQYGSPVKPPQQMQPSSSAYPQLPTARILPHAVPTASTVGSGPGSPASGNKVPIDDVVDKVTSMGFSREQVRATVRRLTENGQSVDLNIVLDKLMNDGDVQPPRGWFNR